jgi:hypothetical protein
MYAWAPRSLVHINRSPSTTRRTLLLQWSGPFVQFASSRQSLLLRRLFLKTQDVSPARAPRLVMIAGNSPFRAFPAAQELVSGAQTPTMPRGAAR